ncbi:putative gp43 [Bifidobacterium actinocoloniiforme DSM 22766]|uniref:Putative gp43 n=1 Tax=Bifidobacterium actinocoloniiforme DSM 22766 TaxID=1437605 RepID=A0A086Z1J6_9BIFI|nr:hypothetical protein [Bifidobacterium actinocoloniiforme]KFI40396.1 putative gp43 [Bifidobacterium actinocoloniiforme DSM 22766]
MGRDLTEAGGALRDQMQWAKLAESSDIIPAAYKGKPANILVAVGFGQSMGLSPAESLYRINVIKGKPTMGAELIAAQVRRAGHKLRIAKDEAAVSVTATVVRADDPDYPISVTRDKAWAERMGLAGNDNYRKQPMTMLTWRAISAVAREACPEALYGVAYTPDEMDDLDQGDADVQARVEEPTDQGRDGEPAAEAELMASKEQRAEINRLLKEGGVSTRAQAARALTALTGEETGSTGTLSQAAAEALLSAPELVVSRTRKALGMGEAAA